MEWMLAQRLFANTNTNTNTNGKNTGDCARDLYGVNVCATAVQKSKHLSNKIATAPRSSSACNCGFIKRAQFNQTSSMAPSRPIYPPQPTAHMWPSLYYAQTCSFMLVKGILHQKIFYRLNIIFWIVMGCGIARFGRRDLKTTETWKF